LLLLLFLLFLGPSKWVKLRTLTQKADSSGSSAGEVCRVQTDVERVREFHSANSREDQVVLFGGTCQYCGANDTNTVDILSFQSDCTRDDESE
jgi:hypothetical protein